MLFFFRRIKRRRLALIVTPTCCWHDAIGATQLQARTSEIVREEEFQREKIVLKAMRHVTRRHHNNAWSSWRHTQVRCHSDGKKYVRGRNRGNYKKRPPFDVLFWVEVLRVIFLVFATAAKHDCSLVCWVNNRQLDLSHNYLHGSSFDIQQHKITALQRVIIDFAKKNCDIDEQKTRRCF